MFWVVAEKPLGPVHEKLHMIPIVLLAVKLIEPLFPPLQLTLVMFADKAVLLPVAESRTVCETVQFAASVMVNV